MMIASKKTSLLNVVVLACGLAACGDVSGIDEPATSASSESVKASSQSLIASSLNFPVKVRGVGSAMIHAHVYENPNAGTKGETVLAVHGLTETGATYERLAAQFFSEPGISKKVARVIAIDLIGHGQSGFPQGLPAGTFGQLTIDDNVSVVVQTIHTLRAMNLAPSTIMGHSMGGLAVQATQQALLNAGTSLAQLGIDRAILLAPVPVRESMWTRGPSANPTPYFVSDPVLGTYLKLPPQSFFGQALSNFAGTRYSGDITLQEVIDKGYVGIEPAVTLAQLTGSPIPLPTGGFITLPRPSAKAGAFSADKGTELALLAFSQDQLVFIENLEPLYVHLTGDETLAGYLPIVRDDATHNMFLGDPEGLIDVVRELYLD